MKKKSEVFDVRVIRKENMDNLIENCIETWRVTYPEEAAEFERGFIQNKARIEETQKANSETWIDGQIPPRLEFMLWKLMGERLGDDELKRIFRCFPMGKVASPKSRFYV